LKSNLNEDHLENASSHSLVTEPVPQSTSNDHLSTIIPKSSSLPQSIIDSESHLNLTSIAHDATNDQYQRRSRSLPPPSHTKSNSAADSDPRSINRDHPEGDLRRLPIIFILTAASAPQKRRRIQWDRDTKRNVVLTIERSRTRCELTREISYTDSIFLFPVDHDLVDLSFQINLAMKAMDLREADEAFRNGEYASAHSV
jgi:hypothetical protein